MTTPRTYIDQNLQTPILATSIMTDDTQHEVRCGMCGRIIYVEEQTFNFVSDAIEAGLDNPFRCALCKVEYDDLVYEG